jgi:hypothetical protein
MKKKLTFLFTLVLILSELSVKAQNPYTLVVEGFDWGPAVNKVVLANGENDLSTNPADYDVQVTRTYDQAEQPIQPAKGKRTVLSTYSSDAEGNRLERWDLSDA